MMISNESNKKDLRFILFESCVFLSKLMYIILMIMYTITYGDTATFYY